MADSRRGATQRPSSSPTGRSRANGTGDARQQRTAARRRIADVPSIDDAPGRHVRSQARPVAQPPARGRVSQKSVDYKAQAARHAVRHRRSSERARKPRGRVGCVIGIILVIALLAGAGFVLVPRLMDDDVKAPQIAEGTKVQVVIPDGAAAPAVAKLLAESGVVPSSRSFLGSVQGAGAESSLKSGAYEFTVGMTEADVIAQLQKGPNSSTAKLALPEGYTVKQTAEKVEKDLRIPAKDFLAQAKASTYVADYPFLKGVEDDSLEGYLCPKTYDFTGKDVTADTVIRAMLDQWKADFGSTDLASAASKLKSRSGTELSAYDLVNLAAIVEREAVTDAQRPKVASVMLNRLKQGMPLQSDATMMYVTGGEVTAADLKKESPYNTYLNKGLPPTPICTPSKASLDAVLSPADTKDLYFFITQDSEYFSQTYDQHLQAIEAEKTGK